MSKAKPRAINKSKNDAEKILEQREKGLKPNEIVKFFEGKYSYWQVYNTCNPDRNSKNPNKVVGDDGKLQDEVISEDNNILVMPDIDLGQFGSIEKFFEHQITELALQISGKNLPAQKSIKLFKELVAIHGKVKIQQIEHHLKNPNAKLIVRIMRRLKKDISDDEIMLIYKEEKEKIKMEK